MLLKEELGRKFMLRFPPQIMVWLSPSGSWVVAEHGWSKVTICRVWRAWC